MHEDSHHGPGAIRVLIAEVPALLAAVIENAVNEEPDMEVVRKAVSGEELLGVLQGPVDVVVTASSSAELAPELRSLFFGPNPLPIVTISLDGERIDVYGRTIHRGRGIEGLTRLIREAVAATRPVAGG
jgi:DNA-binding NarL/FixJ family response regulator